MANKPKPSPKNQNVTAKVGAACRDYPGCARVYLRNIEPYCSGGLICSGVHGLDVFAATHSSSLARMGGAGQCLAGWGGFTPLCLPGAEW
jgi:hypothetical protein